MNVSTKNHEHEVTRKTKTQQWRLENETVNMSEWLTGSHTNLTR